MSKELRVYVLNIDLMSDDELKTQPVFTADDNKFIELCETFGDVYTLKKFQDGINLGQLQSFEDAYVRFIEVAYQG
jgi:hypothetical protein